MAIKKKTDKAAQRAIDTARRVLRIERDAIGALEGRLNSNFASAVDIILSAKGKVIVTGIGKSGIICQKMASTLASTGTSAFFLHPAEGAHGDLGVLGKDDVLIAVSNSGESEEIVRMLPAVKRFGVKTIGFTGKPNSTLARYSDVIIDVGVKKEACPLGLAPTASTTATLAMGDALAVALLERRGFKAEDFAELHPAGSLGKKLLKVSELMHSGENVPRVGLSTHMKDAILEMTAKRLGLTGVFKGSKLAGVITDGDLRRALEKGIDVFKMKAGVVMTKNPKTIMDDFLAEAALRMMEEHSITAVFVKDKKGLVKGVLHLHDLIRAGVI
ncbi:MAG: KpsF/GutQ family sugar-phosphate isomerase [Deltaproteobacteria bacterium]|nr:KpsF/GutQ family sugar-phosphate isomerase [Deltaproteobacteria bacterium]